MSLKFHPSTTSSSQKNAKPNILASRDMKEMLLKQWEKLASQSTARTQRVGGATDDEKEVNPDVETELLEEADDNEASGAPNSTIVAPVQKVIDSTRLEKVGRNTYTSKYLRPLPSFIEKKSLLSKIQDLDRIDIPPNYLRVFADQDGDIRDARTYYESIMTNFAVLQRLQIVSNDIRDILKNSADMTTLRLLQDVLAVVLLTYGSRQTDNNVNVASEKDVFESHKRYMTPGLYQVYYRPSKKQYNLWKYLPIVEVTVDHFTPSSGDLYPLSTTGTSTTTGAPTSASMTTSVSKLMDAASLVKLVRQYYVFLKNLFVILYMSREELKLPGIQLRETVLNQRVVDLNLQEYATVIFEDLIIALFNDIFLNYGVGFNTKEFYEEALQQQFTTMDAKVVIMDPVLKKILKKNTTL